MKWFTTSILFLLSFSLFSQTTRESRRLSYKHNKLKSISLTVLYFYDSAEYKNLNPVDTTFYENVELIDTAGRITRTFYCPGDCVLKSYVYDSLYRLKKVYSIRENLKTKISLNSSRNPEDYIDTNIVLTYHYSGNVLKHISGKGEWECPHGTTYWYHYYPDGKLNSILQYCNTDEDKDSVLLQAKIYRHHHKGDISNIEVATSYGQSYSVSNEFTPDLLNDTLIYAVKSSKMYQGGEVTTTEFYPESGNIKVVSTKMYNGNTVTSKYIYKNNLLDRIEKYSEFRDKETPFQIIFYRYTYH